MKISAPGIITPSLDVGLQVGEAFISIRYAGETTDNRQRYGCQIDLPDYEFYGDDLLSGVGGGSLQQGLAALLALIGAFAEGWRYGEEDGEYRDLFPAELAEWAMENEDELSSLQMELEERPNLIEE